MKTVLLDCASITAVAQLHRQLAELLQFPAWYGGNLDALYDCLTDIGEETCLQLVDASCLDALPNGYGGSFLVTLRDAGIENDAFTFEII